MENEQIASQEADFITPVGDKEKPRLEAKKVRIANVEIKPAGQYRILYLVCVHPAKEEPIRIKTIELIRGRAVKAETLWWSLDEDKKIQKGSAVAILLEHLKVANVQGLIGKEDVDTTMDDNGYLCIKVH